MVSTPPYSSRTWSSRSCVEQFGIYKDEDQLTGYNYYKNSARFVRTFVVAAILGVVTLLVCLMVNDIAKTTSGTSNKRDRDGMHILLATPRPPRRTPTNQTTTTTNYTNLTSIPSTTTLGPEVYSSTQTTTTIFGVDHTPYLTVESATKILRGDSQVHEGDGDEHVVERMGADKREDEETEESKDYSVEYSSVDGEHENADEDEGESEVSNDEESIEYNNEEEEEEEEVENDDDDQTEHVVDDEEGERRTEALAYTIDKSTLMDDGNDTKNVTSFDESKSEAITYNKHGRGNNYSVVNPAVRTRQYVSNQYGGSVPKIHVHLPYNAGSYRPNVFYSHPGQHYIDHTAYGMENGEDNRRSGKFDKNVQQRFPPTDGNRKKKKKRKRIPVENQIKLQPPLRRHSIVEEYQTPILIDYDTHKGLHINHNLVNSVGGGDGIRRVSVGTGQDENMMGQLRREKNFKRNSDEVSIARRDDEVEHRQIEYPMEHFTFDYGNEQLSARVDSNYQSDTNQNTQVLKETTRENKKQDTGGEVNGHVQGRSQRNGEYVENRGHSVNKTPMQEKIEDAAFEAYAKYWNPYLEDLNTDAMVSEATEARIVNRNPKREKTSPRPFVNKGPTKAEINNNNNNNNNNFRKKLSDNQTSGSKKYPQLTNYHYPKDAKNIRDIIKYLTNIDENKTKQDASRLEKVKRPQGTIMKLKGVYLDHGEDIHKYNEDKNDENVEEDFKKDGFDFVYKNNDQFTSLNGHAYIADPFYEYKPENMADINSLVSPDFRFPTPTNEALFKHTLNHLNEKKRIGLSHNPNTKYFPKPPITFNTRQVSAPSSNVVKQVPGKYTTAIYRPLGATRFTGNDKHENGNKGSTGTTQIVNENQYQLDKIKKNLARRGKSKPKPLSVMLDIYPLLDQNVPEPTRPPPNRVKFNPINFGQPMHRPVVNYVPRPYNMLRKGVMNHKRKDEGSGERYKTQMVVHLNLHPKKKNQNGDIFRADERKKTNSRMDINRRKMNVYPKRRYYNEDYEGEIKRDNDEDYYEDDDDEVYEEDTEGKGEVVDTAVESDPAGGSASRPSGEVEEDDDDAKGETKEEGDDEDIHGSETNLYRGVSDHEEDEEDEEDEFKGRELTLVLNADFMRPQVRNEYFLRRGKAVPLIGEKTGGKNQTQEVSNENKEQRNVTGGLEGGVKVEGIEESTITPPIQLSERNYEQRNEEDINMKDFNLDDVKIDVSKSEFEMRNTSEHSITETFHDSGSEKPFNRETETVYSVEATNRADENVTKTHGFTIVEVPRENVNDSNETEFGADDRSSTDGVKENPLLSLLKTELENDVVSKQEDEEGVNTSETVEERMSNYEKATENRVLSKEEEENGVGTKEEEQKGEGINTSETVEERMSNEEATETNGKDNEDVRYSVGETETEATTNRDQWKEYSSAERSIVEQMYSDVVKFSNTRDEAGSNGSNVDVNGSKYSVTYSKNVNELLH